MNKLKLKLMAVAGVTAMLAACGGGSSGGGDAPQSAEREVPASAMASPRAYSEYAKSLDASDDTEPLAVDKVVAPVSDTDEPIPLS
jgi:ABC-type glycerol-3-phosphate transport system substrate-binding protein